MFHNFISLGAWCPTAASMSKYGLRNGSFLFDWLGTPRFESVIHFIENEFSDFLLKENIYQVMLKFLKTRSLMLFFLMIENILLDLRKVMMFYTRSIKEKLIILIRR